MDWHREWGNSDGHPQIVAAGFWGALVFRAFCRISTEFNLGGRIPPQFQRPEWLAKRLDLTGAEFIATPCNALQRGIVAATHATLLVADGEDLLIDGWGRRQGEPRNVMTATERSRRHRGGVAQPRVITHPATPRNVANVACNENATATVEERRGEEKREEEKRKEEEGVQQEAAAPPADAGPPVPLASSSLTPTATPTSTAEDLQDLWNTTANAELPRWQEMPEPRRRTAKARLRERPLDGVGGWREVIARMSASAFCRGANDRGWRADPEFLLRPGTAAKILEGKYDDRFRANATGPPTQQRDWSKGRVGAEESDFSNVPVGELSWDSI